MDDLIAEGLSLMVFGMGFVIVFLTLLVFVTSLMSRLVMRFEPAPVAKPAVTRSPSAAQPAQNDAELVAVMTAAIRKFRSDRDGQ
ncbi:OadG family protein [Nitrincola tapanii]|uniref:Probable oxaloacetate decarboxylase gamma chain n=1 Tax=Nitrincola tapanii TaxID=1708751 RepID=A0A5A9W273_9GAMM|nr:OadG family protein [Nitrincola tapanii]KAA0874692.1 oxaloacetate decarboxylase [Nitrincola tapanii]